MGARKRIKANKIKEEKSKKAFAILNEGVRIEDANLYVKEIFVDQGRMLKRIRTAPQGRAHRIRKHSNHVTVVVDSAVSNDSQNTQS